MPLTELTDAEVHELALGIYRDQYLIVDDDPYWGSALMFMAPTLLEHQHELGGVLVPLAPHMGGLWGGNVPALVLECKLISKPSWIRLSDEYDRILAATQPAADTAPEPKRRWEARKPTKRTRR